MTRQEILGPEAMKIIATYRAYTEAKKLVEKYEEQIDLVRELKYEGYEEDIEALRAEIRVYKNMERTHEQTIREKNISSGYVSYLKQQMER